MIFSIYQIKIEIKYEELEELEEEKKKKEEDVRKMILSHCNFHLTTSNHIKFIIFFL